MKCLKLDMQRYNILSDALDYNTGIFPFKVDRDAAKSLSRKVNSAINTDKSCLQLTDKESERLSYFLRIDRIERKYGKNNIEDITGDLGKGAYYERPETKEEYEYKRKISRETISDWNKNLEEQKKKKNTLDLSRSSEEDIDIR